MFKKSFRLKIILPAVVILSILVVVMNIFLAARFSSLNDGLVSEKMLANINSLNFYLDSSTIIAI